MQSSPPARISNCIRNFHAARRAMTAPRRPCCFAWRRGARENANRRTALARALVQRLRCRQPQSSPAGWERPRPDLGPRGLSRHEPRTPDLSAAQPCHARVGVRSLLAAHRGGNPRSHRIVGGAQRIGRQVGVARRRRCVLVAEQRADDRQAQPAGDADAGETVPQIMKPDVCQRRPPSHPRPYFVYSRSGVVARMAGITRGLFAMRGSS